MRPASFQANTSTPKEITKANIKGVGPSNVKRLAKENVNQKLMPATRTEHTETIMGDITLIIGTRDIREIRQSTPWSK